MLFLFNDVYLRQMEAGKVVEILKAGGVVLHPTETVWGLACDATNKNAVDKISAIKGRSANKQNYIVLLAHDYELERYVKVVPEICWSLIEISEKPITIIYPKGINLAQGVCAEDGSVAIRITSDPAVKKWIEKLRRPIISTSANVSGGISPVNFEEIDEKLKSEADYIVNLPPAKMTGKPSSILKIGLDGSVRIIRK